jgi:hypothetical protein
VRCADPCFPWFFFAEEELFEERPDPSRQKTAMTDGDGDDNETTAAERRDGRLDTAAPPDKVRRGVPLAAAYFVPASNVGQYTDAGALFGDEPKREVCQRHLYLSRGWQESPPPTTQVLTKFYRHMR